MASGIINVPNMFTGKTGGRTDKPQGNKRRTKRFDVGGSKHGKEDGGRQGLHGGEG